MAFARLVGDRPAIAAGAAIANILPFQPDGLHRHSTSAFARIGLASLTGTVSAHAAKNTQTLLNRQNMHLDKRRSAAALSRLIRDEIAFAIILAIADIIDTYSENRISK